MELWDTPRSGFVFQCHYPCKHHRRQEKRFHFNFIFSCLSEKVIVSAAARSKLLYGQSRTQNTRHVLHHEAESGKLQTEILTQRIPCLSYLSACLHKRQKQNSHCFHCQKASWTTLKGFHLSNWPDAVWKNGTFYSLASCCRDSWTNYLLPITLQHCCALPHSCCFHPKRRGQMRPGSLASGHVAAGDRARGRRWRSRQRHGTHVVTQPLPSAEGDEAG